MSVLRAVLGGATIGASVGLVEGVWHAVTSAIPMSALAAAAPALVNAGLIGALGASTAAGLWTIGARGDGDGGSPARDGWVTAFTLAAALAWPARTLHQDGRWLLALSLGLLVVLGGAIVGVGRRLQLRRAPHLVAPGRVGALLLGLLAASVAARAVDNAPGDARPADDRRSVLLITVDTLRRDAVGAYGGPPTPNLDRLAASGVRFDDAVTPMPETAPAHASAFTGAHPLRHHVLSNGHRLASGYTTVAERLSAEGFATAAFVSSYAVDSRTGLHAGFAVYDDDLAPGPGLSRLSVVRALTAAWMSRGSPAATPWLLERRGSDTVDAAVKWLQERPSGSRYLLWVHLFEPHAPYEPHGDDRSGVDHRARMAPGEAWTPAERAELSRLYAGEVAEADRQIGRLLDAAQDAPGGSVPAVVIVGDHGEMLGEHGVDYTHTSLYEPVVRIPLLVALPGSPPPVPVVAAQVRTMDVAPTLLAASGAADLGESEGVSLLDYAEGRRSRSLGTALIGRSGRSLADGVLIGARNNGVKYVARLDGAEEALFLLADDPHEAVNLALTAPEDTERARGLVAADAASLKALLRERPASPSAEEAAMLRALGYVE